MTDKIRVAVLLGGDSSEREISFRSGVAMAQALPNTADDAGVRALAGKVDAESVQLYYQIALQGREDLPLAPDEHAGFVMTVLRLLAFKPAK